ncbi:MAG: Fe-S cluster assembly protein SufD [SAR202 cluster bacterium Io17-Chloro-G9]|nr:MAG: Fe-S cluster assembly protein SufD [SAR202 cluster bacterium Io17-Chloro-G9]
MTQSPSRTDTYLPDFHALQRYSESDGQGWVQEIRENAWSSFSHLGFPTARRGNEKWKYTNVRPIAYADFEHPLDLDPDTGMGAADLKRLAPWNDEWMNLVFIDGRFSTSLSSAINASNGARVASLADVIHSDGEMVKQHLARYASVEEDGFMALNTAFLEDGAFIYVPEGQTPSSVVNLIFVTTGRAQPRVSYPRTLVVAERNARATVLESYIGLGQEAYFTDAVTEIVCQEGARVEHYRLLLERAQAFHVGNCRVYQSQDSEYESASFSMGAAVGRNEIQVLLDAPGASCSLNGLYFTTGSQHLDNMISIDHAKPRTKSRLFYKGILDGASKAVFGGTVLVQKDAQKADARQTDKNLLLSDDAEVDSKPSLFIYADDVQCSHGATAGHMDENTLFYMRSRGLDLETASRMLVQAFAREVIDTVRLEPLRDHLDSIFLEALPNAAIRLGSGS